MNTQNQTDSNRVHRLSRRELLAWAAGTAGSLWLPGCGSGSTGGANRGVPKPNVTVLPGDGTVGIAAIDDTSVTLTGAVPALQLGAVLVSGQGEGFLRRVKTINKNGTSTVLETEQATLPDLFQSASIRVRSALAPSPAGGPSSLAPGVQYLPPGSRSQARPGISRDPLKFKFEFKGYDLANPQGGGQTGSAEAELNGTLDWDGDVVWDVDVDDQGITSMRRAPTMTFFHTGEVNFRLKSSYDTEKYLWGEQKFAPITVIVDGVPLIIVPAIALTSQLKGSVEVGYKNSYATRLGFTTGTKYERAAGWSPIGDSWSSMDSMTPDNIYDSFKITVVVMKLELKTKVYGVFGPYVGVEGGLELETTADTAPAFAVKMKASMVKKASAGMKADIAGSTLCEKEFASTLEAKDTLWQKSFNSGTISGIVN